MKPNDLRAQYHFVVCAPDPQGLGRGFKVAFEPLCASGAGPGAAPAIGSTRALRFLDVFARAGNAYSPECLDAPALSLRANPGTCIWPPGAILASPAMSNPRNHIRQASRGSAAGPWPPDEGSPDVRTPTGGHT